MTEPSIPQPLMPTEPTRAPRRRRARLWTTLAVTLAFAAGVGVGVGTSALVSRHDTAPAGLDTGGLVKACRAEIKAQLVAPATARWPGDEVVEEAPGTGPGAWRVDGAVDSENRLGALLRGYWTCFGAPKEDGRWDVSKAELNQK